MSHRVSMYVPDVHPSHLTDLTDALVKACQDALPPSHRDKFELRVEPERSVTIDHSSGIMRPKATA